MCLKEDHSNGASWPLRTAFENSPYITFGNIPCSSAVSPFWRFHLRFLIVIFSEVPTSVFHATSGSPQRTCQMT
jgi:hypothetical protein